MISNKRELYATVALLAMVFVAASALFAVPAWSQDESDDLAGEQADETGGREADNDNSIESIIIDRDCTVDSNAEIVFEDPDNNDRFRVENGDNVRIRNINNQVVIKDLTTRDENDETPPAEDEDIKFFTNNRNDEDVEEVPERRELVVESSSGIECTDGGEGGSSGGEGGEGSSGEEGEDGIDSEVTTNQQEGTTNSIEQTVSTSTANQDSTTGEGTTGTGVSASAGPDGSSAQAGGATAQSDPDEQAPVSRDQGGDVVDEVQTTGPLPDTGGASVATGTSLVLVLFGVGLLAVRLVVSWRERS